MKTLIWLLLGTFLATAEPVADIVYARPGGTELKLDLEVPEGTAPAPLVIMLHGGSWSSGSRDEFTAPELVENGIAVATVDYRLAPDYRFPSNIQDVKAAIRFLRAHAGEYRLDPNRFGLWGSSAGGHLAALAALSGPSAGWDVGENLNQSSAVQAVVDWFGPTHFLGLETAPERPRQLVVNAFGSDPLVWRQGSPLFLVHAGAPPFLIMHGRNDRLVPLEQSETLNNSLKQAGVTSDLVIVENAGHGFRPDGGTPSPAGAALRQRVVQFFLGVLGRST